MIKEGVVQRKLKIEEFQKQINEVGPSVLFRTGTGCPEKLWMPHHRWPSRSAWMRLWAVLSGASGALSLLRRKKHVIPYFFLESTFLITFAKHWGIW